MIFDDGSGLRHMFRETEIVSSLPSPTKHRDDGLEKTTYRRI